MNTVERQRLLDKAKRVQDLELLAKQWGHKWSKSRLKREEKREELKFLLGKKTNESDSQRQLFESDGVGPEQMHPPATGEVCLPLSLDEFLFMWEGGFLCHPAILVAMLRESASEIADSRFRGHPDLEWEQLRQVPLDVRVFISDDSESLTEDWRMPFSAVNRVEVVAEEVSELRRKLNQTHQGFRDDFPIVASTASLSGIDWPMKREWVIRESPAFVDAKRLDSTLGAIAVAGYVERILLVEGHIQVAVDDVGWMGAALLNFPVWSGREENRSTANGKVAAAFAEFVDYIRDDVGRGQSGVLDVRDRLSAWSHGEDDFPGLWVEVSSSISEEVSSAIAKRMRRGFVKEALEEYREVLSPWMKYVLLLWRHKGVRNRSSNARQSLMHSLFDFVNVGLIGGSEGVLIAGYHGWHIGYMLCVAPPNSGFIEKYGGPENWWKLRLPTNTLFGVSKRLLGEQFNEPPEHHVKSHALKYPHSLEYDGSGLVRLGDVDVNAFKQHVQDGAHGILFIRRFKQMLRFDKEMERGWKDSGGEKDDILNEISAVQTELLRDDDSGTGRELLRSITRWLSTSKRRSNE